MKTNDWILIQHGASSDCTNLVQKIWFLVFLTKKFTKDLLNTLNSHQLPRFAIHLIIIFGINWISKFMQISLITPSETKNNLIKRFKVWNGFEKIWSVLKIFFIFSLFNSCPREWWVMHKIVVFLFCNNFIVCF